MHDGALGKKREITLGHDDLVLYGLQEEYAGLSMKWMGVSEDVTDSKLHRWSSVPHPPRSSMPSRRSCLAGLGTQGDRVTK